MEFYAHPYSIHQHSDSGDEGFMFTDAEEFFEGMREECLEGALIEFVDGTPEEQMLFDAAEIDQSDVCLFIETIDDLSEHDFPALYYLLKDGLSLEQALAEGDIDVSENDAVGYAEQLVDDCYDLSDFARKYFDYEKLADDMLRDGDITEFDFGGTTFVKCH